MSDQGGAAAYHGLLRNVNCTRGNDFGRRLVKIGSLTGQGGAAGAEREEESLVDALLGSDDVLGAIWWIFVAKI